MIAKRLRAGFVGLAMLTPLAAAQPYVITRSTIDAGGAMNSSGGTFVLSGTIGQPDTGVSSGGPYALSGGFWARGGLACRADLSGSSDPNDPGYGVPDGVLDISDFFYYLDQFVAMNFAVADLSGSSDPNDPGYGVPDGMIDISDFFYYLDTFVAGCP